MLRTPSFWGAFFVLENIYKKIVLFMLKHFKYFEEISEYYSFSDSQNYLEPHVSYAENKHVSRYNKKYYKEYLTFNVTTNGSIYWKASDANSTKTISYSKDFGMTWTAITSTTAGVSISVSSGDTVMFKGDNVTYGNDTYYNTFSGTTCQFNLDGNIMSLLFNDNFAYKKMLPSNYTFRNLFMGCTGLTSAENFVLPSTALTEGCYMYMFSGCSSLNYIKCLATDISATNCTYNWVYDVSSSGTFIKNSNMSDWTTGDNGIPSGWTVQDA